ncbi:MAG: hypothetical protein JW801_17365 [Bacteroidales bacterium]|nr:hypothetical protein [Bacteroidales bacterium]
MLFILGTFALFPVRGQFVEAGLNVPVGLAHSAGFDFGGNGLGLEVDYLHVFSPKLKARGGFEFGYTGWGNQILLPLGVRFGEKHQMELELVNGPALYEQQNGYVTGGGVYYTYTLFGDSMPRLKISIGLRCTVQPSYREYSNLYTYFDLPVRLHWQFGRRNPAGK